MGSTKKEWPHGLTIFDMSDAIDILDPDMDGGVSEHGMAKAFEFLVGRSDVIADYERQVGKMQRQLTAAQSELERTDKPSAWGFCPECGSEKYTNENFLGNGSRFCESCGQDWWTDVDYSDTVAKILQRQAERILKLEQEVKRLQLKCHAYKQIIANGESK